MPGFEISRLAPMVTPANPPLQETARRAAAERQYRWADNRRTGTSMTTPRGRTSPATWAGITLLMAAVSIFTVVFVARAQPGRVPRVGYLSPASASDPQFQHGRDLFLLALRELGFAEGQNVAVEYRWAEG